MKQLIDVAINKTKITQRVVLSILAVLLLSVSVVHKARAFSFFQKESANAVLSSNYLERQAKFFTARDKNLRSEVVKLALNAYVKAQKDGLQIKKPIITVIDYSLASTVKRLWVLDLEQKRILYNSLVAHGKYSGQKYATNFSDRIGSLQSSIGVFITGNTYEGQHGYSLKIKGLERGFNTNAEVRTIVIHGAWYVTEAVAKFQGYIGKSWGCPALEPEMTTPIIDTIKNGTLVFSYYPDKSWLHGSRFVSSGYEA